MALKCGKKHDWDSASFRWNILVKAYPSSPKIWFHAADAALKAANTDLALQIHQQACKRFPNHPNTLFQGAKIALLQGNTESATELLVQAQNKHSDKLETWLQSSSCAISKGLYEEAETLNAKARELAPNHPLPHKQYAEIATQKQDWQTALKRWEQFRKQFPEYPAGYLLAAEVAEKAGDDKLARKLKLAREYDEELLSETVSSERTSFFNRKHRHATLGGLTELIWTKAIFNLRSETQRNYLSYLWWILEPLLHMVVYFLVFGFLLQRGGEGFTTFLLTGLIPWMWFSKAISNSRNSIIAGQGLMLQVGIPSIVFPLVNLLQASLKQIPVFLVLFAFVWLQGHPPDIQWLALIPVVLVQILLTVMLGCLLAALIPFIRDLGQLVPTGLTFAMFLSGIFYSYERIPADWQDVFLMNPMAFLLKCYRDIFIDGSYPDFATLGGWAVIAGIGCALILLAYQKLRYVFPRVVLA